MAEENKGRGYCPTYGEDNDSLLSDVAIPMENGGTTESEVGDFLNLLWILLF